MPDIDDTLYAPSFDIKVDGTSLTTDLQAAISRVRVDLSIEKADWFSFTLENPSDIDLSSLELGKSVEIKFGYVDDLTTLFKGLITSMTDDFSQDGHYQIIVEGMDKSFKMMKGVKTKSYLDMKHSDIVSQLASNCGLTAEVENTSVTYEYILQNQVTDYQFAAWMAEKNGYILFYDSRNEKLIFKKPFTEFGSTTTLKWGQSLISFSRVVDVADQSPGVKVRGWDPANLQAVVGESQEIPIMGPGTKTGKSILSSDFSSSTADEIKSQATTQDEAQNEATSIYYRYAAKLISGRAVTWGDPALLPGSTVQIEDAGRASGKYYIVSATHSIDSESGYLTEIGIGGSAV